MLTTTNYGLKKPEGTDVVDIQNFNDNADIIDTKLKELYNSVSDLTYQTAGGTATTITLSLSMLVNGYSKTFIASANNSGAATTINGKPLYKASTTTAPNLISGKAYTVWYDSGKSCFFIKASAEGNTVASHVLAGETFSNDTDTGIAGTMPSKSAATYTPTTSDQTIAAGQYLSGAQTIKGDANLVSANIKAGVSIFGVAGNSNVVDTSAGTAAASQILSGAIAFVDGAKVTGTIPSKAAATYTPTTSDQTIAAGQYLSGAQTIKGDANLVSANIKSGVAIFGIAGNSNVVDTSPGTATAAQIFSGAVAYVDGAKLTGTMPNNPAEVKATRTISALNLISDGSFEDGSTWFWGTPVNAGTLGIGSAAKFGSKSISLKGNTSYDETYVTTNAIPYVQGHKYYCAAWVRSDTANTETQIYWPEVTPYPTSYLTCVVANTWYRNSFISADSTIVSGNYAFRLDNNNHKIASTVVFDGLMLIDLTASFGAGSEPTLSQMDELVDALGGWFDGTTLVNQIPNGAYVNNGTLGGPNILLNDSNLIPDNIPYNKAICGIQGTGYGHGYGLTYEQVNHALSPDTSIRATATANLVECDHWNCRYIASGGTALRRFDWQGKLLWEFDASDDIRALAVGKRSNLIAIGTYDGKCQLVNADNGSLIWSTGLRTSSTATAVKFSIDLNYIYVAYLYGATNPYTYYLRKITRSNGLTVWEKVVPAGVNDIQVDCFGNVFVAYDSNTVKNVIFDTNGNQIVTLNGENYYTTSIAVDDGRYFYIGDYNYLKRYDGGGTLIWSLNMGAIVYQVHIKPNSNYIYALGSRNAWQINRDGGISDTYNFGQIGDHASVLNDFGQLYVATSYSYVDAYNEWIVLK